MYNLIDALSGFKKRCFAMYKPNEGTVYFPVFERIGNNITYAFVTNMFSLKTRNTKIDEGKYVELPKGWSLYDVEESEFKLKELEKQLK